MEALDAANQQLRAAQEQHHTFVAMVAHEMRGPLGPIMNYAMLAKRPAVTPEKRDEYMDIIVEHANRMNRLVDDLQTATRLSTGRFSLQRQLRQRPGARGVAGARGGHILARPAVLAGVAGRSRFRLTWTPTAWRRRCAIWLKRGQVYDRGRGHRAKRLAG